MREELTREGYRSRESEKLGPCSKNANIFSNLNQFRLLDWQIAPQTCANFRTGFRKLRAEIRTRARLKRSFYGKPKPNHDLSNYETSAHLSRHHQIDVTLDRMDLVYLILLDLLVHSIFPIFNF